MDTMSQLSKKYKVKNTAPIAAAYLRVSSKRQKEEGYSQEAQLERIKEYVDDNKWKLPKSLIIKEEKPATKKENYQDEGLCLIESFSDRPKLTELLILAQKKAYEHLIIYSRDRLSRVVEDTIALELFFQRCGVKIHYVRKGEDFDSHNSDIGRLMHILFTSLAEMEGELLSSRVKDGGRACVAKGRWPGGKIPFGYLPVVHTNNSNNKRKWHTTLKKSEFESELIKEVFELYNRGMGYRRLAEAMNRKYGFIYWSKGKIESIIKNENYSGRIVWDRRGGRRNSRRQNTEPIRSPQITENVIINDDIWQTSVMERKNRDSRHDAYYHNTSFILKDKLFCNKCGNKMKTRNPGINKSNVYTCATTKEERKKCDILIPSSLVENEFKKYMQKNIILVKDIDNICEIYTKKFNDKVDKLTKMKNDIEIKLSKCKSFNLKVKERESEEQDLYMKQALHTQYIISSDLIEKYNEALDIIIKKESVTKKSKDELRNLVQNFLPSLFINQDNNELTRLRREFIIYFIDKVIVSYDEINREVNIENVEFISQDLI